MSARQILGIGCFVLSAGLLFGCSAPKLPDDWKAAARKTKKTRKTTTQRASPTPRQVVRRPLAELARGAPVGEYVTFPAVGVRLPRPEGFEEADSFHGFVQPNAFSSVMAVSVPGPYEECTAGFTAQKMRANGWTLLSKEEVEVDGLTGVLIHFQQPGPGGGVFLKWLLVFGNQRKTTIITATFPKFLKGEFSAELRGVVVGTQLDNSPPPAPGSDAPFTVVASKKLKLTPNISVGKSLIYTKDGVIPGESPGDPFFIVTPSLGNVAVDDEREYALRHLHQTAATKIVSVTSTQPITIDGLDGFESLADAEEDDSAAPLILYQVMLFDGASYIAIVGRVRADASDEYLPEFRAMARSLRRKL